MIYSLFREIISFTIFQDFYLLFDCPTFIFTTFYSADNGITITLIYRHKLKWISLDLFGDNRGNLNILRDYICNKYL